MPAPRRKYTTVCRWCWKPFHPWRRTQQTCSVSCHATRFHASTVDREKRRAWCRKGQQVLQAKRWKQIAAKLKGCKTLGDAYRLGRKDGYAAGYQRGQREDKRVYRRRAA